MRRAQILESRAGFLFRYIKKKIDECGMERKLLEGMRLTGGGAVPVALAQGSIMTGRMCH